MEIADRDIAALSRERQRYLLRLATTASVATAAMLVAVKLFGWLASGSVSILASLVDSMMDGLASIINLFAVRYALMPADDEHRFGHGKAEALAGLGQATFIAGSAVFLVLNAVDRLLNPQPLSDLHIGIGIMAFATVATFALVILQRYVIRRTGSTAVRADSVHYVADLLSNIAIVVALLVGQLGWVSLDPILALAIAGFILFSAWRIGNEAVQTLMDRELPEDVQQTIRELALGHPGVHGIHELRTRQSGPDYFIQLHLEMDDMMRLAEAHEISDVVERHIRQAFPNADVLIHQDPIALGTAHP